MVETDVSCVKLSSEPSLVNCSDRRALLPGSYTVEGRTHMESSRCHGGATGLTNPSLELLKSFFFFSCETEERQGLELESAHLGI